MQTALLKTYRHWSRVSGRGDPTAYVRRVVVTTHTSWLRRLASTEQVMETLPDQPAPAGPDRDDELLAALRELPPRSGPGRSADRRADGLLGRHREDPDLPGDGPAARPGDP